MQTILGKIALASLSVAMSLLLLEFMARGLLPLPYPPDNSSHYFTCDPNLGWTGQPNYEGIVQGPEFHQAVKFNALGMHDRDHAVAKITNTFRILMLGDSFVHALQVSEAETAHQLLENKLNQTATSHKVEVISGGVVNWGTNNELLFYRHHGRQFQPDLVLLMLYIGNDLQDNLPGNVLTLHGINCYAPYFAVCDDQLNPVPLTYAPSLSRLENNCNESRRTFINLMGKLYQNSRLYQQIEPLIIANQPRQYFGRAYPTTFSALYVPSDEAELAHAWQVTLATIRQLQQEVTADGHEFAVALISPGLVIRLQLLSPAEQTQFWHDSPAFAQANANQPNQRLADFFQQQHLPFLDLAPPMVAYGRKHNTPLYLVADGHWTATGHEVAATALATWLQQTQLIPHP